MNVLIEVFNDIVGYFNPRTKRGRIALGALIIITIIAVVVLTSGGDAAEEEGSQPRLVEVSTPAFFSGESTITFIGTVEAVNEARLESEASGRVTSVNVTIGDTVRAGQTIAQLENQSQYASLLQAEGAYEAAVAAAAQSDVGVEEAEQAVLNAKRNAVTSYKSAYNTVGNTLVTVIDQFFSNPNSQTTPGLRIDGGSQTQTINSSRIALGNTITTWGQTVPTVDASTDLNPHLDEARAIVSETITLLDLLIARLNDTSDQTRYTEAELRALISEISSVRSSLISTNGALDTAENNIAAAEDALNRTEIGGSSSELSAANAQVKQALGRLRGAQAEYQKTIIRTPIAGSITSLDVKTGDFIGMQTPVAIITNDNALEVTAFVGETEKNLLFVGQEVQIENEYVGRVSAISSAINPNTRKTEVKIQTDTAEIESGDTVRVSIVAGESDDTEEAVDGPIVIPITAVKFTASDGFIFVVVDNKLEARPVTLGPIQGNFITIEEGVEANTEFVVDARGLSAGTEVETKVAD